MIKKIFFVFFLPAVSSKVDEKSQGDDKRRRVSSMNTPTPFSFLSAVFVTKERRKMMMMMIVFFLRSFLVVLFFFLLSCNQAVSPPPLFSMPFVSDFDLKEDLIVFCHDLHFSYKLPFLLLKKIHFVFLFIYFSPSFQFLF
jgi:hypothetical protein